MNVKALIKDNMSTKFHNGCYLLAYFDFFFFFKESLKTSLFDINKNLSKEMRIIVFLGKVLGENKPWGKKQIKKKTVRNNQTQ